MSKNNIYSFYPEFIEAAGFKTLMSVYIPSIHRDYDVTTISFVFQRLFGTVHRIDSVYNEEKPNFKSVFVYYYENNYFNKKRQPLTGNKVFPSHYVQNRQIYRVCPIKPNEYWLIFENKTMFPDTTLTLDEISLRLEEMRYSLTSEELKDQNEFDILAENCEYLRELRYAENTIGCPYLDTTINIHQLAQNVKLMIERYEERKERNFRFEIGGTTIFVEGIPAEFKEPELWVRFSKQPGLIAVKVCKFPKTKDSMECGYVCFESEADAETAIKEIAEFKMAVVV